jgi:hypothetical protein
VPGGVYVTWSKNGIGDVQLTIWRDGSAPQASRRGKALRVADQQLLNVGSVAGVPASFYGDTTGGAGTTEAETVFASGIYVVRVHTDQNIGDRGQVASDVTRGVYSRLTLITSQ